MTTANPLAECKAIFLRLLQSGKPIALEDASRLVVTPEGFDRRAFGQIPRELAKAGLIVEAGYRRSETSRANCAIKRLWVLAKVNGGDQ